MTVYLIRSDCGRVKVGFTDDHTPEARLAQLQGASPRKLECILHFVHREWFEPSSRLAELIGYVRHFGSAAGFFQAVERPMAWAEYCARQGSPPEGFIPKPIPPAAQVWKSALADAQKRFPREPLPGPEPLSFDWFGAWAWGSSFSLQHHAEGRV